MKTVEPNVRTSILTCLVIAIVTVATWLPRMSGSIDLRWDGGAYYIVGTSLANNKGYRLLSEPGDIRSSVHAPFLPALVAAHQLILKTSDPAVVGPALRVSILLVSVGYAVAIFLFLSAYVCRPLAFTAALIGVLQPQFAYFSDALYAEMFFGLFTLLFFILQSKSKKIVYFLLSGLFAVLAYEARTAGIALLVAWVADNLLRRDFKRTFITLAIAAVPVMSWIGWIAKVESSPEYQKPAYAYQTAPYLYFNVSYAKNIFTLKDPSNPQLGPFTTQALATRVLDNLLVLPVRIGEAVSTWAAPAYLSLPLALVVLTGLVVQARRRQYLILSYVILSLTAFCLTPFNKQFVRYLLPLYPFFALAMFQFLAVVVRKTQSLFSAISPFALGIPVWVVVGAIALQEVRDLDRLYDHHDAMHDTRGELGAPRLFYYAPVGTEFDEALDWLRPRGKNSDVIAATDPHWAYLRTRMKAVLPPFELDGKKAQQLIDTVPVKYLIVETNQQTLGLGAYYRFTSALLRDNSSAWNLIWRSSNYNVEVYERSGI